MPIFVSPDTAHALKSDFSGCESRALFKDKFNFIDHSFDEDKQISLNLFLSGGRSDIDRLRGNWDNILSKDSNAQKAKAALKATASFRNTLNWTPTPVSYSRSWLEEVPNHRVRKFSLTTASRLLVGLANGTLENAGCSLHPRFGFPIIPGSALKGVARDAAKALKIDADIFRMIFGSEHEDNNSYKGRICFLDAFAVLQADQVDLEMDILTPHYQQYYSKTGNPHALDEESPIPSEFPAVCPGVKFEFVLLLSPSRGSSEEYATLLDEAEKALKHALIHHGIGAKTASGYGHFTDGKSIAKTFTDLFPPPEMSQEETLIAKWKGKAGNTFSLKRLIADLKTVESPELLASIFDTIMPKEQLKNFRAANPYWAGFLRDGGKDILEKLNRPLPKQ